MVIKCTFLAANVPKTHLILNQYENIAFFTHTLNTLVNTLLGVLTTNIVIPIMPNDMPLKFYRFETCSIA